MTGRNDHNKNKPFCFSLKDVAGEGVRFDAPRGASSSSSDLALNQKATTFGALF